MWNRHFVFPNFELLYFRIHCIAVWLTRGLFKTALIIYFISNYIKYLSQVFIYHVWGESAWIWYARPTRTSTMIETYTLFRGTKRKLDLDNFEILNDRCATGFWGILSPIGVPREGGGLWEYLSRKWQKMIENCPPWLKKILKLTCLEWRKIIFKYT